MIAWEKGKPRPSCCLRDLKSGNEFKSSKHLGKIFPETSPLESKTTRDNSRLCQNS